MHFTRILLQDFMRYEYAEIELHPGLNAFVGPSDAGKSTIQRAIAWVCYGRPLGLGMCRAGSEETRVTLTTSTGHTVTRIRSKKRNAYQLDTVLFESTKTDVPTAVSEALGIRLADLGTKAGEMLGVSRQLDGPFLLTTSPADSAKVLGRLSGIALIDQALGTLRPDILATRRSVESLERAEAGYQASIKEYAGLPAQQTQLEHARGQLATIQHDLQRFTALESLRERMHSYNQLIASIDTQITQCEVPVMASETLGQAQTAMARYTALERLQKQMEAYNTQMWTVTQEIGRADQALEASRQHYKAALVALGHCPYCGAQTL